MQYYLTTEVKNKVRTVSFGTIVFRGEDEIRIIEESLNKLKFVGDFSLKVNLDAYNVEISELRSALFDISHKGGDFNLKKALELRLRVLEVLVKYIENKLGEENFHNDNPES